MLTVPRLGAARAAVALAAALPLALAAAQRSLDTLGPLPASAARFREDMALLAGYVSAEAERREAQVEAARADVEEARWGLTMVMEASPEAAYRLDLARGTETWNAGLDVELALGAARDADRLLRAQAALAAAEGRYRAQLRSDLRAGLLALSQERLDARALSDAEAEAAEAAEALAAAVAAAAPPERVAALEVTARLAEVELERRRLSYRSREALLAGFGSAQSGPVPEAYLNGPLPPGLSRAEPHREAAALAAALARAELAADALPFELLRQVELSATYEAGRVEVGAELALRRGVPAAEAQVGLSTGDGPHRLRVGLSASLQFRHDSWERSNLVLAERELARAAQAEFEAAQPAREAEALTMLELAYEELHLLLMASDAAAADLAAARAEGRDDTRLKTAARRAEDAAERAWQRYVRALFDYLDTTDTVLGPHGALRLVEDER